jgi:peptidoglycan hydrolase-like protein with peptidoglycan-binding domain
LPAVNSDGGFHYVPSMRAYALDKGLTVAVPKQGSLFLVTWDGSWGLNTHAGLVTRVRVGGDVETVEGNISDKVIAGRRTPAPNLVFLTPTLFERDGAGDPPRRNPGNRFAGYPTIRRGSRGGVVRTFQHSVNQIDADRRLAEDGGYGSRTETACRDFQKIMGMAVDGVCGPLTWGALDFALDHAGF